MIGSEDQVVGCILAGAIGDSMGGPYEGRTGPIDVAKGSLSGISDDTQLTLATCEAIGKEGTTSPELVANRFLHWYRRRLISGAGASTMKALRDLEVGAHWSLSGRSGEMAAGNGAAMRIAPLSFCLDLSLLEARSLLREVCWITHQNEEAYCGALAVAHSIQLTLGSRWAPNASLPLLVAERIPDSNTRDALISISRLRSDSTIQEVASAIGCSAFVAESVPLAIFASQQVLDLGLEETLLQIVQVGGDTDTNASIVGQIAGAGLGLSHIPASLYSNLPDSDLVISISKAFAHRVGKGI